MKRLFTLLLAGMMAAAITVPATAQHSDNNVSIEIRDGKVFINGEEAEGDDDGNYIIKRDGKDLTVQFDEDSGMFWFGDDNGDSRFRSRAWFGGEGSFMFRDNDDDHSGSAGSMLYRSRPGGSFVFGDDHGRELRELLENERGSYEHLTEQLAQGRLQLQGSEFFSSSDSFRRDSEIEELALRIRRADEEDRQELEDELDQLLTEAFNQKLDTEQERLADMERRIQDARERISERASSRDEIIARRRARLLGQRDRLDW